MRLTILQVGEAPGPLRDHYPRFGPFFERMFADLDMGFCFDSIPILDGAPLPDPGVVEGVIITGSAQGVYDTPAWIDPLRRFIRDAHEAATPMLGVCFGHQIMADALGGDVRKSEKGWGIGRHVYDVVPGHDALAGLGNSIAIAASHQDQVIVPPPGAETFLCSDFTPHAGLLYANGAAISVQPHPEFDVGFSRALVELRRGNPLPTEVIDERLASLDAPLDNKALAKTLARFLLDAAG
ncbi:MAG: type 1 glutamine amidotransferase [Alphaproteobacteria bacterium]|nr:type 1 glutamine amidotransferase [Alphaproteobacteria bacterium]